MQPCFPNVSSINFTATRTCGEIGVWLPANISECSRGKSAFLTILVILCMFDGYDIFYHTAVPQLRLVQPGGPQYNVIIQTPFTLQCIAEGYPVTTSIGWTKIQGNEQSRKNKSYTHSNFEFGTDLTILFYRADCNIHK